MKTQIRTKNPSAGPLRGIDLPFKSIVRLGSRTPLISCFKDIRGVIECNSIESIENSRDKLRMKECFSKYDVPQAEWKSLVDPVPFNEFPLVGKAIVGFKGRGMVLINNEEELRNFIKTHDNNRFFIERFYNYAREYRIHATRDHAFLAWRKLRKSDVTERWFFNSSNCNWVNEEHELFSKPNNWSELENAAIVAVRSVGLDIGAVDIRVQSRTNPNFIVCEVNSAPQLGEVGIIAYRNEITKILINKHSKNER